MPPSPGYAAYLLRLREMQDDSQTTWVASVQSVATGEQRSFSSVEALATFLLATYQSHLAPDDAGRRVDLGARQMRE
jgi:hypothetical protein